MPQLVRGASREGGKNLNQEVQTKKPGEREREKKRVFLQRNTRCKSHVLNDVPDEECTSRSSVFSFGMLRHMHKRLCCCCVQRKGQNSGVLWMRFLPRPYLPNVNLPVETDLFNSGGLLSIWGVALAPWWELESSPPPTGGFEGPIPVSACTSSARMQSRR